MANCRFMMWGFVAAFFWACTDFPPLEYIGGASSSSMEIETSSSSLASSSSTDPSSSSSAGLCGDFEDDGEKFCDERDGKKYKYVKILGQTWMAEDLNYNKNEYFSWARAMAFNDDNCNSTVCNMKKPHRGICPSGWHLPSIEEWSSTFEYFDDLGALLKGFIREGSKVYEGIGSYWWSADDKDEMHAEYWYIGWETTLLNNITKRDMLTVRCVKDEE